MNNCDSPVIRNFLRPGCRDFAAKLHYFGAAEKWIDTGLPPAAQRCLEQSFEFIKRKYETAYYHTLFHLLTCAFCLDRGHELLIARSHPQLPRLAEEHPGALVELARIAKQAGDEQSLYFTILYEKLGAKAGVMVRFRRSTELIATVIAQAKAAGVSKDVFPTIAIPRGLLPYGEEISLRLQRHPLSDCLEIGFQGGTPSARSAIKVIISYLTGESEEYHGKTLSIGGTWSIEASKAGKICRIEVIGEGE